MVRTLDTSVKRATHQEIALNLNACKCPKYLLAEFRLVIYEDYFIQFPVKLINKYDAWYVFLLFLQMYDLITTEIYSRKNIFVWLREGEGEREGNTDDENQRERRKTMIWQLP